MVEGWNINILSKVAVVEGWNINILSKVAVVEGGTSTYCLR